MILSYSYWVNSPFIRKFSSYSIYKPNNTLFIKATEGHLLLSSMWWELVAYDFRDLEHPILGGLILMVTPRNSVQLLQFSIQIRLRVES